MSDAKLCRRGSENLSTLHRRVASPGESARVRLNLGRKSPRNALPFGMTRRDDLHGLQDCIRVETETVEDIAEKGNKILPSNPERPERPRGASRYLSSRESDSVTVAVGLSPRNNGRERCSVA